jgi:hypothetical protein
MTCIIISSIVVVVGIVKGKGLPITCHVGRRGVEVQLYSITSALDDG